MNWKMTCLVGDVLNQFQKFQKEAERTFVMMADLLSKRDQVLKALDLMLEDAYPGGREEKFLLMNSQLDDNNCPPSSKRMKFN